MIILRSLDINPCSVRVGDLIFFRSKDFDNESIHVFGEWLGSQEWFKSYLNGFGINEISGDAETSMFRSMAHVQVLVDVYVRIRDTGSSPEWLSRIPREFVRFLEFQLAIHGQSFDQYVIVPQLPYAGFGYVVLEDEDVFDISRIFGVPRLSGIRQLSGLTDPTVNDSPIKVCPQPFRNTRFEHSLDTCAVSVLIGTNCQLSKNDLATLKICGFTHDVMTPAGGDAIKRIDPIGLDEDANYREVFRRPGWENFRDRYGLSEQKMVDTVLGKGLLGRILDLADKISYTGRDLWMFICKNRRGEDFWLNFPMIYDRMISLLNANPSPCSVWECARVVDGQLVLTDAERLADFLRIRALMFKALYFNAAARFAEAGYLTQIARFLYEDGILTKDNLLEMQDHQLFALLSQALGVPEYVVGEMVGNENPRVELFETAEEALRFERQIAQKERGTMTCLDVHPNPSGNSSSNFNVLTKGRVIPFSVACPFESWDIQQILREQKPYRVFLYNLDVFCRNEIMKKRLIASRDKRIFT